MSKGYNSGSVCRLCAGKDLNLVKPSNIKSNLSSDLFAVTESRYGITSAIYRCAYCQLLQCPEINDPLPFYQALSDPEYDRGAIPRSFQMKYIVDKIISRFQPNGRLLDIGAATGLLVARAMEFGYVAQGIEPSASFQRIAMERGLPVYLGTFPSAQTNGFFDIITLIDVLEHVADPIGLLKQVNNALSANGIVVIVTPDVSSPAARIFGWKWWHYRVAHINYFSRRTLSLALHVAGFEEVFLHRPPWFFPIEYLFERMKNYLPIRLLSSCPKALRKKIIPINFFDSMLVVVKKAVITSASSL